MGNAASVKPEFFSAMKAEYEAKKDTMTDEELFAHMKAHHDKLQTTAPSVLAGIHPLVVAGPSGVGKGTIIGKLMEKYPNKFGFSVSHTTREPRPDEVNGTHYHFTTEEEMKAGIARGEFLEHADVHDHKYGTSNFAVLKVKGQGKIPILDIDIQGVQKVKSSTMACKYVFIMPPSAEELEKRLRGRSTESEENLQTRLANAKGEMEFGTKDNFDAIIINEDLDKAVEEVLALCREWNPSVQL